MKCRALLFLALCAWPALPGSAAPVEEPAPLVQARQQFEARLAALQSKIKAAVEERTTKYLAELEALAAKIAGGGKLEDLAPLRDEHDAVEKGDSAPSFNPKDDAIPASLKKLRAAYDADLAKIPESLAPEARKLAAGYLAQLEDLQRKLTTAGDLPGAIAVRSERENAQGMGPNPLDPDEFAIGVWMRPDTGERETLKPGGGFSSSKNLTGTWRWSDRKKRKLIIHWDGKSWMDTWTLSPDGRRAECNPGRGPGWTFERAEDETASSGGAPSELSVRAPGPAVPLLPIEKPPVPSPTAGPEPSPEFRALRAEYDAQRQQFDLETRPLVDSVRTYYVAALVPLQKRLADFGKTAEADAVADEITRVKAGDDSAPPFIPAEMRTLRTQYELELRNAMSRTASRIKSMHARYLQQLAAAAQNFAARGALGEVDRLRFERDLLGVSETLLEKHPAPTVLVGDTGASGEIELPKEGALLAGFRVCEGGYNGEEIIKAITPVFRTASGDFNGKTYGQGNCRTVVLAQPGYAVGSLLLKPGSRLMGMQVTFMKVKSPGPALDPKDAYSSAWIGGRGGDVPRELSGGGRPVVGVSIRSGADVDGLGVIYLP